MDCGLCVVHSDHLERLLDFSLSRMQRLKPMQEEVWLTHTQGAAEWMKQAVARQNAGICAAIRVEMPGSFLWSIYTRVLGLNGLEDRFDKVGVLWQLYRLFGDDDLLHSMPVLQNFMSFPERPKERRYQLARRIADLYDQYMVYRSDWLQEWMLDKDQDFLQEDIWQAQLFRRLIQQVPEEERSELRFGLHDRFVCALQTLSDDEVAGLLPARIVFVAAAALQPLVLDALMHLSGRTEVLLLVFNPCRYYWSDIISERELFRQVERKRKRTRNYRQNRQLQEVSLEDMHAEAHPLLAAWGQLIRDFMGQLDAYDLADQCRVEVFSEEKQGDTLLAQVQQAILNLLPLAQHPGHCVAIGDRSIRLEITHSRQREMDVLQDQILGMLAADQQLTPRDIVVMVPDIELYAPAILATMQRYERTDSRWLPFSIADRPVVTQHPLLLGIQQLLEVDRDRFAQSGLIQLLSIPAVTQRLQLDESERDQLLLWCQEAGLRWGLDAQHRQDLHLSMCGEQNTWQFALERMLAGYAGGSGRESIEPLPGVQGVAAAAVGALAQLLEQLSQWRSMAAGEHAAKDWQRALETLLQGVFQASDKDERLILERVVETLDNWRDRIERQGEYEGVLPLSVVRTSFLEQLEEGAQGGKFLQEGIVFCSLLPLRALPFKVVCLLGLNEGEFPRRPQYDDFDLMQRPGQFRMGDRSRVADDRAMFLQAILSARQTLYLSWQGLSRLDGSVQPPSLLLVQWMDYLNKGWKIDASLKHPSLTLLTDQLSHVHPMTAYDRAYFEKPATNADGPVTTPPHTYAREWLQLYKANSSIASVSNRRSDTLPMSGTQDFSISRLASWLRNPARFYFENTLAAFLATDEKNTIDTEAFDVDPLQQYKVTEQILEGKSLAQLRAEGHLPPGICGERVLSQLNAQAQQLLEAERRITGGWSKVQTGPTWI